MMDNYHGRFFGFADHSSHRPKKGPATILGKTDDLLAYFREHENKYAASEKRALKKLADALKSSATKRKEIVAIWLSARIQLADAVRQVDAELSEAGLAMSMADDEAIGDLIGAVEIRFHRVGGGLPRMILDIEIALDGRQTGCMIGTSPRLITNLPPIASVTKEDYRTLLLAFVQKAVVMTKPRRARVCRLCAQPALHCEQFEEYEGGQRKKPSWD